MIIVRKPGVERSIPESRLDFFRKAGYELVTEKGASQEAPEVAPKQGVSNQETPSKWDANQAIRDMADAAGVNWHKLEFEHAPKDPDEIQRAIDALIVQQAAAADAKAEKKEGK